MADIKSYSVLYCFAVRIQKGIQLLVEENKNTFFLCGQLFEFLN